MTCVCRLADAGDGGDVHQCAACKKEKSSHAFSKGQLRNKGPGKQRCIECINAAERAEQDANDAKRGERLRKARESAKKEPTSVAAKLLAASAESAAEAELVGVASLGEIEQW